MIQRTVSPAATGPEPTSCSPSCKRDVGHLARRGIDLIERAAGERIDLHGIDVAVARRLHARGGIGLVDPLPSDRSAPASALPPGSGFSCPGSGNSFGSSTTSTGFGGSAMQHGRLRVVVIGNLRRLVRAAASAAQQPKRQCGDRNAVCEKPADAALRKDGFIVRAPSTS